MKQFKHVFEFEFLTLLKKKTVQVTTVVLCVISLLATFIPTIMKMFDVRETNTPTDVVVREIGIIENEYASLAETIFMKDTIHFYDNQESLEKDVLEEIIELGLILNSETNFELILKDQSLDSYETQMIITVLKENKINSNLIKFGIDPDEVALANQIEIDYQTTVLGKNSMEGYFIGFGIVLIVYIMIILYGQTVATSVAREKDSRTMELLITSTKPKTLILGKVLANSLFGFLQIALVIVCIVIGIIINKSNYSDTMLIFIQGSMNFETALVYIVFSTLGYSMYLFLYGALGSLVSKVEDVGNAVAPIQFVFIAAYFLATLSMSMPNSSLSIISSYIPFTSLFTMPIRNMLTTISLLEILISLGLMMMTTYIIIVLSVYIYRMGTLNYGNKMKLSTIIKSLFKKKTKQV